MATREQQLGVLIGLQKKIRMEHERAFRDLRRRVIGNAPEPDADKFWAENYAPKWDPIARAVGIIAEGGPEGNQAAYDAALAAQVGVNE